MSKPKAHEKPKDIWTRYRVTWRFVTRLFGQTPADPAMIDAWLEARMPRVKPPGGRPLEEIQEEVAASLAAGEGEAEQEYQMLVFQQHAGSLAFRGDGTIRPHLKDCARQISQLYIGKIEGEKAFSTRVINGVYVEEYWVPVCRPGGSGPPIREADGTVDKPVHSRDRRGRPISALKRLEFVEPPSEMTFTLKVLGEAVKEADLHTLLTYGGTHGYAGERSLGEGRYLYEIERLTPEPEPKPKHQERPPVPGPKHGQKVKEEAP